MGFFTIHLLLVVALLVSCAQGHIKRCIECTSRGELGSCKDPFTMNATQIENLYTDDKSVKIIPCASGWCSKIIEKASINNEHGQLTNRFCLQHGPEDNEERCAETIKNYRKVLMCFCHGDLCNSGTRYSISWALSALFGCTLLWTLKNC